MMSEPRIVYHKFDLPEGWNHRTNDRPWIYHVPTNTIHLGPVNSFHDDLFEAFNQDQGFQEFYTHPDYVPGRVNESFLDREIKDKTYRDNPHRINVQRVLRNEYNWSPPAVPYTDDDIWHTSMAADPTWLHHWIERNGPYLYHATQDPRHIDGILQNGLLPWDHPNNPQGQAHGGGALQPRPGHVYLKPFTPNRQRGRTVRVDVRKLDPALMNPDEDNMAGKTPWNFPPPQRSMYEPNEKGGEWAEKHDMTQPSQTAWSLDNPYGTHVPALAYKGVIPPHAIDLPYFEPLEPGAPMEGMAKDRISAWEDSPAATWEDEETHEMAFKRIWNNRNA